MVLFSIVNTYISAEPHVHQFKKTSHPQKEKINFYAIKTQNFHLEGNLKY